LDFNIHRLENVFKMWFAQIRQNKVFNVMKFKASNGWLSKFRSRSGISWRKNSGESGVVNIEMTENWLRSSLQPLLEQYEDIVVFNIDECGLFYKATPGKTITMSGERCSDGKFSKDRMTVLVGANMSGTGKMPL
jgi:hypothetical protein